jgi:alpha-D-ribose 1-methylphosphonate 5-triphosphate synthase subunit PhnH
MRLDPVHDIQRAFRAIMKSWANPGEIVDLGDIAAAIDIDIPVNKTAILAAMVLLDAEVGFSVHSKDPAPDSAAIARLTYGKRKETERADFVFVLGRDDVADAISRARIGTLVDPHLGATIVIETGGIGPADRYGGTSLVLSGPGIRDTRGVSVDLPPSWIAARAARNREFPLGVDLVFVDGAGLLVSLPRTTVVRERP